jgi:DNA-binding PadR family transcriptional regulator
MGIDIQRLSRSCNETLILSILSSGPLHGYQLALELEDRSRGTFRFQHGTLYPILHRLEESGLIAGYWLESSKRRRKSYRLTSAGRRHLDDQVASWREFSDRFFDVIEETER